MAAMQTLTNNVLHNDAAWCGLTILDQAAACIESGRVNQAMDDIFTGLQTTRETMSDEDWAEFARYARENHELGNWIYQDPMTRRAYEKPRGYAGDAVMMDYLYGIHGHHDAAAEASELGREIYEYIRGRLAPSAVRYRREHIAQMIDGMAMGGSHPSVLAVAAGHLREAELSNALASGHLGRFVALDADAESLRDIDRHYARLGVETIHASVRHLLMRKIGLGTFDFVYAAGLYDYLCENTAQALSARLFEMVNPGGQMLIPNFAPQLRDRAYMETFMDWTLIYRDQPAMARLLDKIEPAQIQSYDVYDDPNGSVVYLLIKKRCEVC
jgi:extracellular factor (EF) 3-hydroxypalmitic acid methyl ester biosynthesis protein